MEASTANSLQAAREQSTNAYRARHYRLYVHQAAWMHIWLWSSADFASASVVLRYANALAILAELVRGLDMECMENLPCSTLP